MPARSKTGSRSSREPVVGSDEALHLGLGEAGWTVYSVTATAEEVTTETAVAFRRVEDEQGRLDLLVNNATSNTTDVGPPEDAPFNQPFAAKMWLCSAT